MINPHIDQQVIKLNFQESNPGSAILAVHGRTQDPEFMIELAGKLGWGHLPIMALRASEKSWYPSKFMDDVSKNEPYLTYALENIEAKVNDFYNLGIDYSQIIFLGFSQGACLLSEYVYNHPKLYRGVILYTGGLIGEEGTKWDNEGNFNNTPVFLSTSETDEWVPSPRVRETAVVLKKMNADVSLKIYENKPHGVSTEEIEIVNKLIKV